MKNSKLKTFGGAMVLAVAFVSGSLSAAERSFSVYGYDDVRITGPVNVEIETGKGMSARAEAADRATLDRVSLRRNGSQLVISMDNRTDQTNHYQKDAPVTVYLGSYEIKKITHSGTGTVKLDKLSGRTPRAQLGGFGVMDIGSVDADILEVAMQGGGQISIAGKAGDARINLLGSSMFNAPDLIVKDLQLNQRGPAQSHVSATREAKVSNSGTGTITVDGKANCLVKSDGAAQIICNPKD